jgi:hypothetical protein
MYSSISNSWLVAKPLVININCYSPTQPQHELKLDLIMSRKPPTTPPGTVMALAGNLES